MESIGELLASNTLHDDEEIYLLNFLGKLGTLDSIQVLADLIPTLNDGAAREQLAQVFLQMGRSNWREDIFAKNPHPLETAWRDADGDEMFESAIAKAIAGIGTENGINLLFKSLEGEADFSYGKNVTTYHKQTETGLCENNSRRDAKIFRPCLRKVETRA